MEVIANPRVLPGPQQHAGVGRSECRILARRVLHEELPAPASGAVAGILNAGYFTIKSGVLNRQLVISSKSRLARMSAGFPCTAPASAHLTMVAISSSRNDGSFLYFWMPIVLSRNQGGISRLLTRCLIDCTQGRASLYVSSDIGAISPGR